MKKLVLSFVLTTFTLTAWAQMDMLPFVFRDIPPEFEQGIPPDMSLQEFRELNRNVDFFTIGMSMIWPGYALALVDEPDLAVVLGGARWATYGLMGTAVWQQWGNMEDVWTKGTLEGLNYDRLKTNTTLFVTGATLNMFLWGADVLLAYHKAKEDRDRVIYSYGLARAVDADSLTQPKVWRALVRQNDPRLRKTLIAVLGRNLNAQMSPPDAGEQSWYLGDLLEKDKQPERAMAAWLRGLAADPQSRWADLSRQHALNLLSGKKESWAADHKLLFDRVLNPGSVAEILALAPLLKTRGLQSAFLELAEAQQANPDYFTKSVK